MGQIDQVTQQNTATAEETAASSEELSGQAEELRSLIAQFKLKGGGSTAQAARPAAKPKAHIQKPEFKTPSRKALPGTAQPTATAAASGWDAMKTAAAAKPTSNEEIISLEDKEFGRY